MPDLSVILLAEDREDDVLLLRRTFDQAYIENPLVVVRDGEETIAYLSGSGKFGNRSDYPLPELLLLDLKMPRIDGFEVLTWLREQEALKALPVVVLTCSDDIRDANRAYALGARSFLVKPFDFQDIFHITRYLSGFWLHTTENQPMCRPAQGQPEG